LYRYSTVLTPVTVMLPEHSTASGVGRFHEPPAPPRPTTPLVTMLPADHSRVAVAHDADKNSAAEASWTNEIVNPAMNDGLCPLSVVLEPKR
jgi:hypothetical protein